MMSLIIYENGQAYEFYLRACHTIAQDYSVLASAIGRLCCFCAVLLEASQLLLFLSWLLSTRSHPSVFIWPTSLHSCQHVRFRWDFNDYTEVVNDGELLLPKSKLWCCIWPADRAVNPHQTVDKLFIEIVVQEAVDDLIRILRPKLIY